MLPLLKLKKQPKMAMFEFCPHKEGGGGVEISWKLLEGLLSETP